MLSIHWILLLATVLPRLCYCGNITAILQQLLGEASGYDKRIRPNYEGEPVEVSIFVHVESLGPLRERTMDFSATFYLRLEWLDPRLAFNGDKYIVFKSDDTQSFWIPDVYFIFEKQGHRHSITQTNQMLKIFPNGTCRYLTRVSLTAVCRMALDRFPFDEQRCSIYMMSFSYTTDDIILSISDKTVNADETVFVAGHSLLNVETDKNFSQPLDDLDGERETVLIHFFFVRQLQSYILTAYVPSLLLVIISWMSFWIDAHAAPARITLGITAVMTATTMTASMQEDFPDSKGAKAIDIWLAGCLIFVFFSLIEYALTNYLIVITERRQRKMIEKLNRQKTRGGKSPPDATNGDSHHYDEHVHATGRFHTMMCEFKAEHLDRLARVIFALGFLVFNLLYWSMYVIVEQEPDFKLP